LVVVDIEDDGERDEGHRGSHQEIGKILI